MFTSTLSGTEIASVPAPLTHEESPAPSGYDVCAVEPARIQW